MTVFLLLLIVVAVGWPLASLLDRRALGWRRAGEMLLLGVSAPAVLLLILSYLRIEWNRTSFLAACLLLVVLAVLLDRQGSWRSALVAMSRVKISGSSVLYAPAILLIVGYAGLAWTIIGSENDFIGIWGVKGRAFLEAGRVDWTFLQLPGYDYSHPDYPVLLPLIFSWISIVAGRWTEPLLSLTYPLLTLGLVLVAKEELDREIVAPVWRAVALLVVAGSAVSPWIGLAEGRLVSLGTAGLLLVRRSLLDDDRALLVPAAVLLGLAASTKNEGLVWLSVAFAICLGVSRRWRFAVAMLPGFLLVLPWAMTVSLLGLESYLVRGPVVDRLADTSRLKEIWVLLPEFTPVSPLLIGGCLLAVVLAGWRGVVRERFLFLVCAALLAADLLAYYLSPYPLDWHIRWSWERLLSQAATPFLIAVVILLGSGLDSARRRDYGADPAAPTRDSA